MRRLEFRSIAESELAGALEWYAVRSKGTARRFLVGCDMVLASISREPDRFPRVGRRLRRAPIDGFPYAIYYGEMSEASLLIVGVVHGRRDPAAWQAREP